MDDAISQPTSFISLTIDHSKSYVYNHEFNSALIKHDDNYCTDNPFQLEYSFNNFMKLIPLLGEMHEIIDIGCGQGEFVNKLREIKLNAIGFDSVVREPTNFLYREYFEPLVHHFNHSSTILVLRCVLPHIQNPFHFLNKIFEVNPDAKVYIEFQDTDFLTNNKIWSQIHHDHVNYFTVNSFDSHFNIVSKGYFSKGEWAYVLISRKISLKPITSKQISDSLITLNNRVDNIIDNFIEKTSDNIVVYGGSGKGTLIAWELKKRNLDISIIDENPKFWGKYVEASGVKIYSPIEYLNSQLSNSIIMANLKHENYFTQKYGKFELLNIYNYSN